MPRFSAAGEVRPVHQIWVFVSGGQAVDHVAMG
jgi:hypothetical protein